MKKFLKKLQKYISSVLLIVVVLWGLGTAGALSSTTPPSDTGEARILVKFIPQARVSDIDRASRSVGGAVLETIPGIEVRVVQVPQGREREFINRFLQHRSVAYAEPDYIAHALAVPNDTYFNDQWGISKVGAPLGWDISTSSAQVKVAILDSGIDGDHGDIRGKVVAVKNFSSSKSSGDRNGHGTHVAGIVAAVTDNAKGVAGLGWNASLMNGKVLRDDGSGYYSWIANGLVWAVDNGANTINMSLGGPSESRTLEDAVNYAWSKGAVLVAAAGNSNTNAPSYPAYYTNVIAVAATDQNDKRANFSNFGDWVDVAAPGVNILSTYPRSGRFDRYAYISGTSMASPHVAGLAALVWATEFGVDNVSVRARLESTVDALADSSIGKGRINVARAVGAQ